MISDQIICTVCSKIGNKQFKKDLNTSLSFLPLTSLCFGFSSSTPLHDIWLTQRKPIWRKMRIWDIKLLYPEQIKRAIMLKFQIIHIGKNCWAIVANTVNYFQRCLHSHLMYSSQAKVHFSNLAVGLSNACPRSSEPHIQCWHWKNKSHFSHTLGESVSLFSHFQGNSINYVKGQFKQWARLHIKSVTNRSLAICGQGDCNLNLNAWMQLLYERR